MIWQSYSHIHATKPRWSMIFKMLLCKLITEILAQICFMIITFFFLGGALGAPIFSLKGNQGQGWKPATVRYIGSADSVEVSFILSVKNLWVSFLHFWQNDLAHLSDKAIYIHHKCCQRFMFLYSFFISVCNCEVFMVKQTSNIAIASVALPWYRGGGRQFINANAKSKSTLVI